MQVSVYVSHRGIDWCGTVWLGGGECDASECEAIKLENATIIHGMRRQEGCPFVSQYIIVRQGFTKVGTAKLDLAGISLVLPWVGPLPRL